MRGVSGQRGPLKPDMNFRIKLALLFAIAVPAACAIASLLIVWIGLEVGKAGFLANWLNYTSMIWGIVFGDVAGRRLAAALGYHWSVMAGRVVELLVPIAGFATLLVVGTIYCPPGVALLPALGAAIFVVMCIFGFVRRMMAE